MARAALAGSRTASGTSSTSSISSAKSRGVPSPLVMPSQPMPDVANAIAGLPGGAGIAGLKSSKRSSTVVHAGLASNPTMKFIAALVSTRRTPAS